MSRFADRAPIAVVIPAFRSAATLAETLDSIFGQTLQPAEIIVVDDGSPDDIKAVTDAYANRVQYYRQENQGPGAARNKGVAATTSPYLAFLDADDVWLPERLARTFALLTAREELDFVFADAWDWDGEQRQGSRFAANPPPEKIDVSALVKRNFIPILTVMMRRSAFDKVGGFDGDRGLMSVEDYDLWLRVLLAGQAACCPEKLALYRRQAGSLGSSGNLLAGLRLVHTKLIQHSQCPVGIGSSIRYREGVAARDHAWELIRQGEYKKAIPPSSAAWRAMPFSFATWKLVARVWLGRILFAFR